MEYLSTRGHDSGQHFCDILLEGLAPDGDLYLPRTYPRVDDATQTRWRGLSYAELAFEVLSLYIDDIPADDLRALCERTYTPAVFGNPRIVPLRRLLDRTSGAAASAPAVYIEALSRAARHRGDQRPRARGAYCPRPAVARARQHQHHPALRPAPRPGGRLAHVSGALLIGTTRQIPRLLQ